VEESVIFARGRSDRGKRRGIIVNTLEPQNIAEKETLERAAALAAILKKDFKVDFQSHYLSFYYHDFVKKAFYRVKYFTSSNTISYPTHGLPDTTYSYHEFVICIDRDIPIHEYLDLVKNLGGDPTNNLVALSYMAVYTQGAFYRAYSQSNKEESTCKLLNP
jgi:hypothetical protein